MKKINLAFAILFILNLQAEAQNFKGELGLNLGIPASNLDSKGASAYAGIDILGEYKIGKKTGITADASYNIEFVRGDSKNIIIIPLKAGIRYYPTTSFYLLGKVGVGLYVDGGSNRIVAAYSFGAGYLLSPLFNVAAIYDSYYSGGSIGFANLRIAYRFGH